MQSPKSSKHGIKHQLCLIGLIPFASLCIFMSVYIVNGLLNYGILYTYLNVELILVWFSIIATAVSTGLLLIKSPQKTALLNLCFLSASFGWVYNLQQNYADFFILSGLLALGTSSILAYDAMDKLYKKTMS